MVARLFKPIARTQRGAARFLAAQIQAAKKLRPKTLDLHSSLITINGNNDCANKRYAVQ